MGSVWLYGSAIAVAGLLVACGDGDSPRNGPSADEDERGSIGLPPSAAEYCTRLGFTIVDGQCKFPDGSACEEWAFYRGECGQPHSYCNQHGGSVSSKTENMGT
jgi:putative hemolysin